MGKKSKGTSFPGLYVEKNGPQTLTLDKDSRTLTFKNLLGKSDVKVTVESAIIDERKKFGREMLWWGIVLFFAAGLGVLFIILYYYVKEQVLVIKTEEHGELILKGKKDTLADLHFMIQRQCLKSRTTVETKPKHAKRGASKKKKAGVKTLTCPECGSHDLYYEAALHTGRKYHCKRCDYIGALVIEEYLEI
jgi:hypothetical protein